ncbi:MAG: rRNA methyltransferase [Verrucomicrobiales bacterium]|jgi:tRNA (guanosine-2'-O-)-methyltransferase|nr:rRNA methyltransferase [Verrucomicrobiales bacterium]|tara:strand:+ start:2989 stop:3654 length:666 start_codon:yes stop_codon:yes gene_type:complete
MTANEELIEFLRDYVTPNKQEKIAAVLEDRTRHLALVLEDIYQPHNASACLRSCDCLGVQDIHVVERRNEYRPNNEISMGSAKWLTMHRYHQTGSCIDSVKKRGYRLIATTPNADGYDLLTLPLDQPVAIMFGTEEQGLSQEALEAADATLRLPMYGFTQSYNISIAVALTLSRLVERLRNSDLPWKLDEADKKEMTLAFYRRIVKRHDLLEENFWANRPD